MFFVLTHQRGFLEDSPQVGQLEDIQGVTAEERENARDLRLALKAPAVPIAGVAQLHDAQSGRVKDGPLHDREQHLDKMPCCDHPSRSTGDTSGNSTQLLMRCMPVDDSLRVSLWRCRGSR